MNFIHALRMMVARQVEQVRAINRRFAKPRLTMSPAVQWALLILRLYLLALVGLLGYKFISVVMQ
ncbi:MAG: hypothetical protein ABR929_08930 [Roseiarcus sp.]